MKKITLLFIITLLMPLSLMAVKAYPGLILITQPDGTELEIQRHGDEYFSYTTTVDGYLISENAMGIFEYALMSHSGDLELTGIKSYAPSVRTSLENIFLSKLSPANVMVANMEERTNEIRYKASSASSVTRAYPLSGNPKSLVILVSFSDNNFTVSNPQTSFTNLLNQPDYSLGGGTGSAVDYFKACSNNTFAPNFVVVGPYKLPGTIASYGAASGTSNDINPGQMIKDACAAAYDAGVDFAEFDTDNDGIIDNIFVYYAGYNQAEGGNSNTIWPHRSRLSGYSIGNKIVADYACTSELKGASGSLMCGIGTFCHEFGHVLGLPDWYNTSYSGNPETPRSWSIMDQGSYSNNGNTPPSYSSYERFMLGWIRPVQLSIPGKYTLEDLLSSNSCYLVAESSHNLSGSSPNPRQFFMVENRQSTGWDSHSLPGEGLLITRINYNAATWNNNTPNNIEGSEGYQVMCAYGSTSSNTSANTYPGTRNVTTASFILRDGTDLQTPLTNITESEGTISFLYAGGGDGHPNIIAKNSLHQFNTPYGTKSTPQTLQLAGTVLSKDVNLSFTTNRHFEMRFFSEDDESIAPYGKTLTITPDPIDSTFNKDIQIRFAPTGTSYSTVWTDMLSASNEEFNFSYTISGVAPRQIYVVPPVANEAEDVTPYSFLASWNDVYDAQGYYLTVNSINYNVNSSSTEDFTTFDGDFNKEWYSTFSTISRTARNSSPQAALFKTSVDTIYTETYFMAVNRVTYWVQGYNATGYFKFEAYNGEEWNIVDEYEVSSRLTPQTKSYDFDEADNYIRFRMSYEYSSGNGGLAFDDFTAYTKDEVDYRAKQLFVEGTVSSITGLKPKTTYYYRVQATDQDLQGRYENITDYSNTIVVETLEGSEEGDKSIMVSITDDGSQYMVFVSEYNNNSRVYIFTVDGRLVSEIRPTSNLVVIPQLASGQMYILKYSTVGDGFKRKDKYAKFFYAL